MLDYPELFESFDSSGVDRSASLNSSRPSVIAFLFAIGAGLALSACVSVSGEPLSASALQRMYCVEHQSNDGRDFHLMIAESLRAAGVAAEAAPSGACPGDADYQVTYIDRFSWDMRMFLAKLTIEVMDPNTGEVVAYGESNQDSLGAMGSTYREVIDRAVIQLLGRSE